MRIAILESIVMPAGHEVEFDRILVEEMKKQGHEPVFFVPEKAKTFGQLTAEEKSTISHRGKALKSFAEKLETYLGK